MRRPECRVGCPPRSPPSSPRSSGSGSMDARQNALPGGRTRRPLYGRQSHLDSARGSRSPHPMSLWTSTGYLTALTVSVSVPDGTLTVILSPFFLPTSARPTGDSTEMRPADGSLSTAPTRWYVSDDPSVSTTSIVEPGPATLECDSLMICALPIISCSS